jgi:hypothetical protein
MADTDLPGGLNLRRSVLKVRRDRSGGTEQRNPEILPPDDYLQISGLPFKMSPEMTAETAFFGTHESSFASAERMMRKYLPTRISDTLIRMDKIPDKPDRKGILYIMADGAAVNTRLKGEQRSGWKENRPGLVF